MKGIAVALLLLLVLTMSGYAQVPDDQRIVPAQRIGRWTLNMMINELLKMNGPRSRIHSKDVQQKLPS